MKVYKEMKSLSMLMVFLIPFLGFGQSYGRSILFTDPVENAKLYNWLALGYGIPHALMSEIGYFYH